MGTYLNPSSKNFQESLNSEIYVDKSELIAFTNRKLNTKQKYLCVSRPRRFGKTMAADMLAAYYTCGHDTRNLFRGLNIETHESFEIYRNQFDVIKMDMQSFLNKGRTVEGMLTRLKEYLLAELTYAYPDVRLTRADDLTEVLNNLFNATDRQFVLLIDEWDCVMRRMHDWEEQKLYLDFLRDLMKDQPYIALAYMTGILPIKKYGEHSTLNMFYEYSMIDSAEISDCFGFTEEEVRELCTRFKMDFKEAKDWYDGYHLIGLKDYRNVEYSMYSPKSIIESMLRRWYSTYWNQTETYEALKVYIQMNFDGLRDAVVEMLAGNPVKIDTHSFRNDMNTFACKDDVLTLLVHLGYLSYNPINETVVIPNNEVAAEFVTSIKAISSFSEVSASVQASRDLLESLWNMDGEAVASGVEKAHQQFPSIKYNNENALSCVIELAFYYAREYYTIIRELPTGKGFADICYLPKPKHPDRPAVIIELKWDKSVDAAIDQIKRKEYPAALSSYHGNLLLCGINYDKTAAKQHICHIEKFTK